MNSAAISAKRSSRPSAQRYSMVTVQFSIHPSSRRRCTKASVDALSNVALFAPMNPMVGNFRGCCARAPERQRRRACKRDNEFSSPDVDCHVTLLWGSCNGGNDTTPGGAALRDFKPTYVGSGSQASEAIGAGGRSMSAVPPIASKFCAPQQNNVRAKTGREQTQHQSYSITSSARASSIGEISGPNTLAVRKLITSSKRVG